MKPNNDSACYHSTEGMFVQCDKFIEGHAGKVGDISIYNPQSNYTTWQLDKKNLVIRGIEARKLNKKQPRTFHVLTNSNFWQIHGYCHKGRLDRRHTFCNHNTFSYWTTPAQLHAGQYQRLMLVHLRYWQPTPYQHRLQSPSL